MKLPPVEYEAPTTVAEAIDLLAEYLDEASVLAGGQSLIPLLALRLARPAVLIDINGLAELSEVSETGGWVAIGATYSRVIAPTATLPSVTDTLDSSLTPLMSMSIGGRASRSAISGIRLWPPASTLASS